MRKFTPWRWIVGALALAVVAAVAFVWFGPVTIGDKRLLLDFLLGRGVAPPTAAQVAQRLHVPPGFRLELYSSAVPLARWPLATASGDLVVARTRADAVVLLERDRDGDGKADAVRPLLDGLERPHGLALHDGWLYVGERTGIGRVRFDEATGRTTGAYARIVDDFTGNGFHETKTLGFGPDGWLYVAQGSSCNACVEQDARRATVMRMRPDGTQREVYASGLRNSVGFDWAPWDGALYATENGRDLLGDDFPPDELNRIERGGFYGWPYVNGFGVPDPDVRPTGQAVALVAAAVAPVHGFRPHNAPLGLHFLRGPHLPAGYERTALVALHGSWNRSTLDGYKVVALDWRADGSIVERDFLTGFLGEAGILGRPAGITQGPDGAIFVTDDYAGVVYRIVPEPAPPLR
jgi:glucose/arabinose dehydrogenase